MSEMSKTLNSLRRSIQILADPKNDPETKIDEIENALRDIADALAELHTAFAMVAR